ncbi:carboxylesterase/lipase family protein [Amycolatopsis sp. NPDC059657]|uniref:carboxylesterase/lipase family protein n=1 Tax=Amycolatopsis sp. NPDC059657 TaxID=3346899 RepID=UPI00366C6021
MSKRITRISTLALAFVAVGALTDTAAATGRDIVRTEAGAVRGTVTDGHRTFEGIPFAAPPVGELRWKAPQPARPWTGVRDATKPGARCAQAPSVISAGSESEDCLYLNVTTPAKPSYRPRPVMVWVHGGGFTSGAGSDYDVRKLATGGDAIVVTVNYRLGAFGFLGYPGLADSGVFGIEDQQAALRWVKRNAAAFGGDAHNVTLFGESAGGFSVCSHLASPLSAGLFDRAIIQSGPCTLTWPDGGFFPGVPAGSPFTTLSDAEKQGAATGASLGCADLACLRGLPVKSLLPLPINSPVYGTKVLPLSPAQALREGRFNRVPTIAGTTRDEARLFVALFPDQPMTEQRYQDLLSAAFGAKAPQVAAKYPTSAHGSPAMAFADAMTDRVWSCPQAETDRLLSARTRTFAYEFADRDAPALLPFPPDIKPGAAHGSELPYLSDIVGADFKLTPEQQRLSAQMIGYWTRFARVGDPGPRWHAGVLSLAPGAIQPVDLAAEHNCAFWAGIGI